MSFALPPSRLGYAQASLAQLSAWRRFKEEGIVAGLEVLLEVGQHFEVASDGGGVLHVTRKDVLQGDDGQVSSAGDVEILAEGEPVEGVHAETTGEVALGIVNFEE